MTGRFIAIKAQLDSIDAAIDRDTNAGWRLAADMKAELERIAVIKDDAAGNGAELAREIARKAISEYNQRC